MKSKIADEIKSWILTIIISVIIVVFLNFFILRTARVEGSSMDATLQDGDLGITWVFKAKYLEIKRFDIVVIDEKEKGNWIKRVVGLPNETVEYQNGKLLINDKEVEEPFLTHRFLGNAPKITLKENEYFVVGDNRNNSTDSRVIGPVKKDEIKSSGFLVIYPFHRFGVK